jgi:Ras family
VITNLFSAIPGVAKEVVKWRVRAARARPAPPDPDARARAQQGIMLVYDVTRPDTFENLGKWLDEVETYHPGRGRDVVKLLVGNKVSLRFVLLEERKSVRGEENTTFFL